MSNYYNASEMKNAAGRMDEEIRKFETCCSHLEDIICTLCDKWDDDNNKKYVKRYRNDVAPAIEQALKVMKQGSGILKACSEKYGYAIDSGNTFLSS